MSAFLKLTEHVSPESAHVVGVSSGATGLLISLEWANRLTVFSGAAAAIFAAMGGLFYCVYWGCRAYNAVQKVLKGKNVE
ncbi:MAG: hypothetical protein EBR82_21595 [Caulobacteraceae bacterium]|nr:hypothetical protein [Caulobacteraceae bacterium]